jgi:GNAT superfamily N-acetyltransferase
VDPVDTPDATVPLAGPYRRRPVRDDDAPALISLVAAAYAEHPGCVLDLPGVDADLERPATTARRRGGPWWVAVAEDGAVVASVGAGAPADGRLELKRLYVAAAHRRRGLGRALVDVVETHARRLGAAEVELWSDTRFTDAHALYARLGYVRTGEERELHDPSDTTEYRFVRSLS